jgi:hypothetical protein
MYKSYTPLLFFYDNAENQDDFMNTDALLASLRSVLSDFYPLAGRLVDTGQGRDDIDCNDAGVLYQVSRINPISTPTTHLLFKPIGNVISREAAGL